MTESVNVQIVAQISSCQQQICKRTNGDDILQEVCIRCLERPDRRDWSRCQRGYIFQIAKNVAIDIRRRSEVRRSISLHALEEPIGSAEDPIKAASRVDSLVLIREQVNLLPTEQRDIVAAHFLEEKDLKQ